MRSRPYLALLLFTASAAVIVISGCLFADEQVSIDIYGPDEIQPNVTRPDGPVFRINNDVDRDLNDMRVEITVPERIHFKGSVAGKALNLTKGIDWLYTFTTSIPAGGVIEVQFSYMPEIYEGDFMGGNEYSFDIVVEVYDTDSTLLGTQKATWRVVRAA